MGSDASKDGLPDRVKVVRADKLAEAKGDPTIIAAAPKSTSCSRRATPAFACSISI